MLFDLLRSIGNTLARDLNQAVLLAGLFILYDQIKVGRNSYVKDFYEGYKKDGVISKEVLEDRINKVREGKYKPNFSFKL